LAIESKLPPAELNAELNAYLINHAKTDQFATFLYGVFDLRTHRFTFSNAGQCPALLVKNDYVDRLGVGGMVLGVNDSHPYREGNVLIEPGDLLLLYTDGITEQKNDAEEEYGEERLIKFLQERKNLPIGDLQRALLDDVLAFGSGRQDDDITSVFAYYKSA
jgi:sigma-B regulation protein RsbU (phosphoserine phosphatase)